jgi:hypothetical protein
MCPNCAAGDGDLRFIGEFPAEAPVFLGAARPVTTRAYECAKCGTKFAHSVPRLAPADIPSVPPAAAALPE